MKCLSDVISLDRWCASDCGLSAWRHRRGALFLGIIHLADRRFTKRIAKRLLMLEAQRVRDEEPMILHSPEWAWLYIYWDAVRAQAMAASFGFRLPSRLFDRERAQCRALAAEQGVRLSRHEKVRAWLRG